MRRARHALKGCGYFPLSIDFKAFMNLHRVACGLLVAAILGCSPGIRAEDTETRFEIRRFKVEGNTLLSAAEIEQRVSPFVGPGRTYGDVQRALEALEATYRGRGFGTVQVNVPEQELTQGIVTLQVTEAVIGKVTIQGNQQFSQANVRAAMPHLQEDKAPNMLQLSENVQLANENPAKQVQLVLGVSDKEGQVDARLEITEDDPQRIYLTLDDTGNQASGRHRIGVSYQNANLFDRDEVLTLAYITSPDAPTNVKNDVFSIGFRKPLYAIGDSIDFIYAYSKSSTPSTISALGSTLGVTGQGEVIGLRYNHIFPRRGEYTSKLVAGIDYKYINSICQTGTIIARPGVAGCTPYTLGPVSLTYSGKFERPGLVYDYYLGAMRNFFPMGRDYPWSSTTPLHTEKDDYYSAASGYRVRSEFAALRFGGTLMTPLPSDWMLRLALAGQATGDALVSAERLGLAGVNAVRGYRERAEGGVDSGVVMNTELYTPELAGLLGLPGNLKGVFFYDFAHGRNNNDNATTIDMNIAGIGLGVRYNFKKDVSFRYDWAQVADGHGVWNGTQTDIIERKGDTRSHFSLAIGF